jgi:hypothetical protein
MKCCKCGCEDSLENPVTYEADPFMNEVKGDDTKVWKCKDCRYESAMEI